MDSLQVPFHNFGSFIQARSLMSALLLHLHLQGYLTYLYFWILTQRSGSLYYIMCVYRDPGWPRIFGRSMWHITCRQGKAENQVYLLDPSAWTIKIWTTNNSCAQADCAQLLLLFVCLFVYFFNGSGRRGWEANWTPCLHRLLHGTTIVAWVSDHRHHSCNPYICTL